MCIRTFVRTYSTYGSGFVADEYGVGGGFGGYTIATRAATSYEGGFDGNDGWGAGA